jgi:diguanylate cyclase (GGDEF)-like protein
MSSTKRQPWSGKFLDRLADESGLAIVIVDENARELDSANNNSMCRSLYYSDEFAPKCAEFCGKAFEKAFEAGGAVDYECYAGLACRAIPVSTDDVKRVVITGRAFVKSENYRIATGRAIEGDWQDFDAGDLFENVLIEGSASTFEKLSADIAKAGENDIRELIGTEAPGLAEPQPAPPAEPKPADDIASLIEKFHLESGPPQVDDKSRRRGAQDSEEVAAWRSLFGSLLRLTYPQARIAIVDYLSKRYSITSITWFERENGGLQNILATGSMKAQPVRLRLSADDPRLLQAAEKEISIKLKNKGSKADALDLFPVAVGGEIRCALLVGDKPMNDEKRSQLAHFCQTFAPELEILRLREEITNRNWLTRAIRRFNENLKKVDREDFWLGLTQLSAEMLQAERASLLVNNEKSGRLFAKAAIGTAADLTRAGSIGSRVAVKILEKGAPLLVRDLTKIGLKPASADRKYKTGSFVSYPLAIGGRKIAVLNFTDKADGRAFEESDLELLNSIAPQMALAIDRAMLKDKAGEYEQLSVTDALTGLLNRRYLQERLAEEIIRSNRHGYPMSFMMIDVDHFKSYNDSYGHPEGDKALKIVGHVLKETLRGADVAARYGGEEFSILLPQTTSEEAQAIAERIRRNIEETDFVNRKVTVSMGIASCSLELNSSDEVISAADKALYEAKRRGRNNVRVYEDLETVKTGVG